MYHHLCEKCLGEAEDLFWEKIGACNGFTEPAPPYSICWMGKGLSLSDVEYLNAKRAGERRVTMKTP